MSGPRSEGPFQGDAGVRHALLVLSGSDRPTRSALTSCARCGAPLPCTRRGLIKRGVRFCSTPCRLAAVRCNRADARKRLVEASRQLASIQERVEGALAVLGLLPRKPVGGRHG